MPEQLGAEQITVAPSGDGWMVRTGTLEGEMFFRSGASAETAARDLGARLAHAGKAVRMEVHLRDGSVAGRFTFAAG